MKSLSTILLFAGLTIGMNATHTAPYHGDGLAGKQDSRLDDSSTLKLYRKTHNNDQANESISDESSARTDYSEDSLHKRGEYPSASESSELHDFYFRGLEGPEAFDEYLIMVGNLLESENQYHVERCLFIQRLHQYLDLSISRLSLVCSVFVTLLSLLFLREKR